MGRRLFSLGVLFVAMATAPAPVYAGGKLGKCLGLLKGAAARVKRGLFSSRNPYEILILEPDDDFVDDISISRISVPMPGATAKFELILEDEEGGTRTLLWPSRVRESQAVVSVLDQFFSALFQNPKFSVLSPPSGPARALIHVKGDTFVPGISLDLAKEADFPRFQELMATLQYSEIDYLRVDYFSPLGGFAVFTLRRVSKESEMTVQVAGQLWFNYELLHTALQYHAGAGKNLAQADFSELYTRANGPQEKPIDP